MWFIMGGMTSNPFSTENLVPTWAVASEILKGDTQGHPFRGNQFTHADAIDMEKDAQQSLDEGHKNYVSADDYEGEDDTTVPYGDTYVSLGGGGAWEGHNDDVAENARKFEDAAGGFRDAAEIHLGLASRATNANDAIFHTNEAHRLNRAADSAEEYMDDQNDQKVSDPDEPTFDPPDYDYDPYY